MRNRRDIVFGRKDDGTKDSVRRWILTGHRQGMFSKYGSQACNFCVNEAFYIFLVGGSTSSRSKMRQMMLELVNKMLLTGKVNLQWQRYWKLVRLWRAKCSSLLMNETCFPHRNQSQLMEASGGGVMRVRCVRIWCWVRKWRKGNSWYLSHQSAKPTEDGCESDWFWASWVASLGRSPFSQ